MATFTLRSMRLLSRYLLRECLVALAFCFSAFLLLWIALDLVSVVDNLKENRMRGGEIVMFYLCRIPEFLPSALPMAFLLALLYSLSNHARHNEITAIRAAGVSLLRLSAPYFGIGVAAALAMFASNEFLAPRSIEHAEHLYSRHVRPTTPAEARNIFKNQAFHNARPGENRHWQIGLYDLNTGRMTAVQVDWELENGVRRSLFARYAEITNGVWTFYHVKELRKVPDGPDLIPQPEVEVLRLPQFTETNEEIASEIRIADRFTSQSGTRWADVPLTEILNYLRLHPRPPPGIRPWLYTKLHGRLAAPVTCIVVVLLALPFGAVPGRRNVFVGVAASIVIFFLYYMVLQFGFAFGEVGRIPPWVGAWLPNIVFSLAGICMTLRVR